jgi:hypothetical protein
VGVSLTRFDDSGKHQIRSDWEPSWDESDEFLLYAARSRTSQPFRSPDLAEWPSGTSIHNFWLEDEPWPIIIELFGIRSPIVPLDLGMLLSAALWDVTSQDATLSWCMFDGVFNDVAQLFTPWQIERTYGICLPGEIPQVALSYQARTAPSWSRLLQRAADHLYSRYPKLKNLYGE